MKIVNYSKKEKDQVLMKAWPSVKDVQILADCGQKRAMKILKDCKNQADLAPGQYRATMRQLLEFIGYLH